MNTIKNIDNQYRRPGVYFIKCIKNGYIYIGSSKNIYSRYRQHYNKLKRNCHFNKELQSDFNKFGEDSFIFRSIKFCNCEDLIFNEGIFSQKIKKLYNVNKLVFHNPEISDKKFKRLLKKVVILDNGCWTRLCEDGTPYIKDHYRCHKSNGKEIPLHRIFYFMIKKEDIAGKILCHKCDNKYCVNPDHLFPGSYQDNAMDFISKGKGSTTLSPLIINKIRKIYIKYKFSGAKHFCNILEEYIGIKISKRKLVRIISNKGYYDKNYIKIHRCKTLTIDQVIEIRKLFSDGFTVGDLCRKFDYEWTSINLIVKNKTYKNI